MFKMNSSLTL